MKYQLYKPQAISELGGRENQEDAIFPLMGQASESQRVFVVCDGMGGMAKGEVASDAVSKTLGTTAEARLNAAQTFTDSDFHRCMEHAYDALDAADVSNEGSMGTTMTFLCLHAGGCLAAHIGDSRIYHLRPSLGPDKGVLYRSRDHSLVQHLYEKGEISYNEMGTSQRRNIILKAVQPHQDGRIRATLAHITDIRPGDYFYLCTDGMLEHMEDDGLMSILANDMLTDEQKRQRLIDATLNNGDNHSAYLIHVKDVVAEPGDENQHSDEKELRARSKALNDTRKDQAWKAASQSVRPKMQSQSDRPSAEPHVAARNYVRMKPQQPVKPQKTTKVPKFLLSLAALVSDKLKKKP